MKSISRRQFLEESILATAATASLPTSLIAQEPAAASANEKIAVGLIGCGIRGKQHAQALARLSDCDITHVCDPDRDRAAEVAEQLVKLNCPRPKAVQDLRVMLDDKSIAAVFITAPNHWHALAAIWAMQAGKDVYVEKPVSHNISEGRRIVQTARKLGEVKLARSIVYGPRGSIGGPGKYEIPASVDYNLFAGPAPMSPLTRPKFHYDWHWFWDTGNGELGNNNIHSVDIYRWGLGVTGLGRAVLSYGGRLGYSDAGETPNTQVCIYDFGGKTIVTETRGLKSEPFHANYRGGWIFFGTEGIISGSSLFDLEANLVRKFEGKTENHFANFLKAVRSRKVSDLNADILEGHQSTALCHIGNISYRLGHPSSPREIEKQLAELKVHDHALETFERTRQHLASHHVDLEKSRLTLGPLLRLDSDHEKFVDSPSANAFLTREYRKPFVVPTVGEV